MAIEIGTQVISNKYGQGVITAIITKSTGYVQVDFNGNVRKEMACNLTDLNGSILKAKRKPGKPMSDAQHARFMQGINNAILNENFLPCQIASGNYNTNLIR